MNRPVVDAELLADEQAITLSAFIFLTIYAIIHWLPDYEFKRRNEKLILAFAILRVLVSFGVIMPDKEKRRKSTSRTGQKSIRRNRRQRN